MDIESRLEEGISLHQSGELQQAELIYQQILQFNPENAEAYYFMSMIAHQIGKNKVAIELIQKAVEVDYIDNIFSQPETKNCHPLFMNTQNKFADDLKDGGKLEYAIYAYYKSIKMNPGNINAYNNLGNTLRDQGQLEQAVLAYKSALKINPKDDEIHNNLGNILLEQRKLDEATNVYRHALTLNPRNPQIYSNLGVALKMQGEFHEAATIYQESLNMDYYFYYY